MGSWVASADGTCSLVSYDESLFMHLWTVVVLTMGGFLCRYCFLRLVHGKGNRTPFLAALGSDPRTVLLTNVDWQEKRLPTNR